MKRWPLHTAYFWESAPFFRVLLPFACGIAGYERTRPYFVAHISSAVFILIAFIAYVIITYVQKRKSYFPVQGFLLVSGIFFAGGYALSLYDDVRNDEQDISRCVNNGEAHLVRITGTPAEREKTWKSLRMKKYSSRFKCVIQVTCGRKDLRITFVMDILPVKK